MGLNEDQLKILEMFQSEDPTTRKLGITLYKSQNIDMSFFFDEVREVYEYEKVKEDKPSEYTLVNYTHNEILSFRGQGLSSVPSGLKYFIKLTDLILMNNNISQLPIFVGNFKNLDHLDLSNNNIKTLPSSLKNSPISDLDLSSNNIKSLPTVVYQLKNLRCLGLSYIKSKFTIDRKIIYLPLDFVFLTCSNIKNIEEVKQSVGEYRVLYVKPPMRFLLNTNVIGNWVGIPLLIIQLLASLFTIICFFIYPKILEIFDTTLLIMLPGLLVFPLSYILPRIIFYKRL